MTFKGRVAVITGADQSIGKAAARYLAGCGCRVVLAGREASSLSAYVKEITNCGFEAIAVETEVTKEESVRALFEAAVRYYGKIDILCNLDGMRSACSLLDTSLEMWNRLIDYNLLSVFICTKEVVPYMRQNGYGRIINLSSQNAKSGSDIHGGAAYATASGGVLAYSKSLAKELADFGITVNTICPGPVARENEESQSIALAVGFLGSELAAYITGEDIDINGGAYMD